eukprot:scaffold225136_cov39-Tisochrysis_lutea.AAC.2
MSQPHWDGARDGAQHTYQVHGLLPPECNTGVTMSNCSTAELCRDGQGGKARYLSGWSAMLADLESDWLFDPSTLVEQGKANADERESRGENAMAETTREPSSSRWWACFWSSALSMASTFRDSLALDARECSTSQKNMSSVSKLSESPSQTSATHDAMAARILPQQVPVQHLQSPDVIQLRRPRRFCVWSREDAMKKKTPINRLQPLDPFEREHVIGQANMLSMNVDQPASKASTTHGRLGHGAKRRLAFT